MYPVVLIFLKTAWSEAVSVNKCVWILSQWFSDFSLITDEVSSTQLANLWCYQMMKFTSKTLLNTHFSTIQDCLWQWGLL